MLKSTYDFKRRIPMIKRLLLALLLTAAMLHAAAPTEESVTKLYIATFDRAPDASGLDYWLKTGLSTEEIARSFFEQPETKKKYPDELGNGDFISHVYDNLFDRASDGEGFAYWLTELDSGRVTRDIFILAVVNGAQGDDANILNNKTEVGLAFACNGRNDENEAYTIMQEAMTDPLSVSYIFYKYGLSECPVPNPGLPIVSQTTVTTTGGEAIEVKETEAGFIFTGYEGKIVLLEFYGSTCPHCLNDIPMYNSLQAKYGDRLVVISVENYGFLNSAALKDFANSHNMQYRTIAKESSGNLFDYAQTLVGQIGGVPYLIVLDRDGEIVTNGLNAFSESQLDGIIQGL
ncbi:MAG: hypothetical protein DRG30_00310 [Epsilonproteobacteria bacterium]|nr:MAG: hypothetical protein DRG30_00310 [Campylobacterota bacterium]